MSGVGIVLYLIFKQGVDMPLDNINDENESRHFSTDSLEDLLKSVMDRKATVADFIAPTTALQQRTTVLGGGDVRTDVIREADGGVPTAVLEANPVARQQIAAKANIESRTAERLRENYPVEYDNIINAIWQKEPKKVMLRTYEHNAAEHDSMVRDGLGSALVSPNTGVLRALMSDKYKTFDNDDLVLSVIPPLRDSAAQWKVVKASITDKRLVIRFKSDVITGSGAQVNDVMAHGIGISNSETGHGSVSVFEILWTLFCLNGMQTQKKSRSAHLTSSRSDSNTWAMLTDQSKQLDNQALSSKLRDISASYSSRESFDESCERMRSAAGDVIEGDGQAAVEALGGVLKLSKSETSSVLAGLLLTVGQPGYAGQPVSRATLVNAVTQAAHKAPLDNVDEWQALGGKVLDLPSNQWATVSQAGVDRVAA
jgi:hypothetical protein